MLHAEKQPRITQISTDGFMKHPSHPRKSVPVRGSWMSSGWRVSVRSLRKLFQRPLQSIWLVLNDLPEIQTRSYGRFDLRKMVNLVSLDVSCRSQSGIRSRNTFRFTPPIPSEPTATAAWFRPVRKNSHWQGRQRSGELSITHKIDDKVRALTTHLQSRPFLRHSHS